MGFPQMIKIKQRLSDEKVHDIPARVESELKRIGISDNIKEGNSVAITVGSRGVRNIDLITKEVVKYLKSCGGLPFIVPAMGSHGGASAQGQIDVLAHYGVTEEYTGAPIKSSMEVIEIGETVDGIKVFLDKYASEADHIIAMNRIKPHTDFYGEIESGLHKIMTIGLGKHKGAQYYHQAAVEYGLERIIYTVGQTVLNNAPVLCGIGIVENGYDETAEIKAIKPKDFATEEKALLIKAKQLIARLPFDYVDILIVDEIGKDISGTGMDTNVIGRMMAPLLSTEPELPKIKRIIVSDLTKDTEGNALGIGLADFCNKRIVEKINKHVMYTNGLTGLAPEKVRIPMDFSTDREMLAAALETIGLVKPEQARVMHIKSTLHLEHLEVSTIFADEIKKRKDLTIIREAEPIKFDKNDNLVFITDKN
ncbi:MAG: lactate racemase domain-containing protein [Bacillota bacterium]